MKAFVTYLNRAFNDSGINYTEEDAKQLILFEMFYQTTEYRVITKMEKISLDQFISNLSGALSLWTGLSLLSIFELAVFIGLARKSCAENKGLGHVYSLTAESAFSAA